MCVCVCGGGGGGGGGGGVSTAVVTLANGSRPRTLHHPYRTYSHVAIMLQYLCRYLTCSCDIHVTGVMQICNMYVFCVLQTRTVMHVTCMLSATCLCQVRNWDISGLTQACNRSVNVQVCTGMYRLEKNPHRPATGLCYVTGL